MEDGEVEWRVWPGERRQYEDGKAEEGGDEVERLELRCRVRMVRSSRLELIDGSLPAHTTSRGDTRAPDGAIASCARCRANGATGSRGYQRYSHSHTSSAVNEVALLAATGAIGQWPATIGCTGTARQWPPGGGSRTMAPLQYFLLGKELLSDHSNVILRYIASN